MKIDPELKRQVSLTLRLIDASRRTARAAAQNASMAQSALVHLLGEDEANRLVIRYAQLTRRWRQR